MAGNKWTDAQIEAITRSGNNILVSAAAGSGKTAVLVERVIRMITREENPVDIDRLLIMTFTRAAASQMREKIYKAIREKLKVQPGNQHLQKQLMKIHNARICTIDALCSEIVHENFQMLDIDPGFRIADEAELEMLKDGALKEILEEHYADPSEAFLDFVNYYTDKNDSKLETLILTLFNFAQSHPEPEEWLRVSTVPYGTTADEYTGNAAKDMPDWMSEFTAIVKSEITADLAVAKNGLKISQLNYGPHKYIEGFEKVIEFLEEIKECSLESCGFEHYYCTVKNNVDNCLEVYKHIVKIPHNDCVDEQLKDIGQKLRNTIKDNLKKFSNNFLFQTFHEMCEDMNDCAEVAETLVKLTLEFAERFAAKKKEKNLADFSEIAHDALKALIVYDENGKIRRNEKGEILYTEAADRMAKNTEEIIVDEYQDTNMLQEYLVNAISSERFGHPNVFMVGDVKQSIYGFRMACPQLFTEKFNDYKNKKGGELIVLDRNFRSRTQILDVTNRVFEQAMISDIGSIDYANDRHGLVFGETHPEETPEEKENHKFRVEIEMIEGSGTHAKNLEAYEIVRMIEELIKEGYSYKDIAVLTRNTDNPEIEMAFTERLIPAIKNSNSGFFDSFEVKLVMDLLTIVDNPYQDIPFAAVLMSPICSADANDLAELKIISKDLENPAGNMFLYEAVKHYPKFSWFVEKIEDYRRRASFMSISDLFDYIMDDSGIYHILLAMDSGKLRKANLDILREKASSFSRGAFTGLFNFIKYIDEIKKNDIDFGQAQVFAADADAVHMMTIHKSKGLDFKVVILARAGKKRNETDARSSIVLDRELGMGIELRNPETRMIKTTFFKEILKRKKKADLCAEEMRILYVAMTRAVDKLIITGTMQSTEACIKEWSSYGLSEEKRLNTDQILSCDAYLKFIGFTLFNEQEKEDLFKLQIKNEKDVEIDRLIEIENNNSEVDEIMRKAESEADYSEIEADLNYSYPYMNATLVQGKITASQLENSPDEPEHGKEETEQFHKKFKKVKGLTGAERGNAYHKFFELLDYKELYKCLETEKKSGTVRKEIEKQLGLLETKGFLSNEEVLAVDAGKMTIFVMSELGNRMMQADLAGKLHREQQFVMGTLTDINSVKTLTLPEETDGSSLETPKIADDEYLLVQGVIDAYIEDDDGIVLIDYKTDRNRDEKHYTEIYRPQQEEYAKALAAVYGKIVKEKILYSLELEKEIFL